MSLFFRSVLMSLLIMAPAFGEQLQGPTDLLLRMYDTLSIDGPAKLKLVKAKSLDVKGPLEFHRLSVAGTADVTGTMNGENGEFGTLKVSGAVEVDHVRCTDLLVTGKLKASYLAVKNQATIQGPVEIQHGQMKDLTVNADHIILDDVTAEAVRVEKGERPSILVLKGTTVIKGDIVFESGDGEVQVQGAGVEIKGSVTGGTVSNA